MKDEKSTTKPKEEDLREMKKAKSAFLKKVFAQIKKAGELRGYKLSKEIKDDIEEALRGTACTMAQLTNPHTQNDTATQISSIFLARLPNKIPNFNEIATNSSLLYKAQKVFQNLFLSRTTVAKKTFGKPAIYHKRHQHITQSIKEIFKTKEPPPPRKELPTSDTQVGVTDEPPAVVATLSSQDAEQAKQLGYAAMHPKSAATTSSTLSSSPKTTPEIAAPPKPLRKQVNREFTPEQYVSDLDKQIDDDLKARRDAILAPLIQQSDSERKRDALQAAANATQYTTPPRKPVPTARNRTPSELDFEQALEAVRDVTKNRNAIEKAAKERPSTNKPKSKTNRIL